MDEHSRREFIRLALIAAGGSVYGLSCGDHHTSGASDALLLEPSFDAHLNDLKPNDLTIDQGIDLEKIEIPITTLRKRFESILPLEKQPDSTKSEWGKTRIVEGQPHERFDTLGLDSLNAGCGTKNSLVYFSQITDAHLCDEESPARAVVVDSYAGSGWRHQEAYTAQVLDATIETIKSIHRYRELDFIFFTGDMIDNCQYNELMTFLSVVLGGKVNVNSGVEEDPKTGAENDPHDSFIAEGLGDIPWYFLYGNHDGLVQGNLPLDNGRYSTIAGDPARDMISFLELSRVNPPRCMPIPAEESPLPERCKPEHRSTLNIGFLAADSERHHLNRFQFFDIMAKAGGYPKGHGLQPDNLKTGIGDWVSEPLANIPLRIIGLDSCALVGHKGSYPNARIDSFLRPQLEKAYHDGMSVIVASHHPSTTLDTEDEFRAALNEYDHVILHLTGHNHSNSVNARAGKDPKHGYWEVRTSSLIDWPQQSRLIEIVDCGDGFGEIWLTLVDYQTDYSWVGDQAAASRFFSLFEVHLGETTRRETANKDGNVILPVYFGDLAKVKLSQAPWREVVSTSLS